MTVLQEWVDSLPGPPATMAEALDRQEKLAELSDDDWMRAYVRNTRAIVAHPLFRKLVREVAVAEQETFPPGFRRRRSTVYWYTSGSWMTRGNKRRRSTSLKKRAQDFSLRIATDLGFPAMTFNDDAVAGVYVRARDYVQVREMPPRVHA